MPQSSDSSSIVSYEQFQRELQRFLKEKKQDYVIQPLEDAMGRPAGYRAFHHRLVMKEDPLASEVAKFGGLRLNEIHSKKGP